MDPTLWRKALLGCKWQGTVTDDVSGESAAYSWVCDRVTQDADERVWFVLNDGAGGYAEFTRTPEALDKLTPEGWIAEVGGYLRADLAAQLAAARFADLAGEVL